MSRDSAMTALTDFAATLGVPPLAFDEANFACVGFDDMILNIELPEPGDEMAFYIWLGTAPEDKRAEIAMTIADADYLLHGTQGATLGMSRQAGDIVLAVRIGTAGLTGARLAQVVENLLNVAQSWRRRLLEPDTAPVAAPVPPFAFGDRA